MRVESAAALGSFIAASQTTMPHCNAKFATAIQAFVRGCLARRRHTVVCTSPCIDLVNGQTSTVSKRKMLWDADAAGGPPAKRARSPPYSSSQPPYHPPNWDREAWEEIMWCINKINSDVSLPLKGTRYLVTYDRGQNRWHVLPAPSSAYFGFPLLHTVNGKTQVPAADTLHDIFSVSGFFCSFTFELAEDGAHMVRRATAGEMSPGTPREPLHERGLTWSEPRELPFDVPMYVQE